MLNKRGQLTIVIIIAIIVFIVIISLFIIHKDKPRNKDYDHLDTIIQDCIKLTTREGVILNNLQGGYYEVPDSKDYLLFKVPLYYGKDIKNLPSREVFEIQLEKYIEDRLFECINNTIYDLRYKIDTGIPEVDVKLKEDLKVNLNYLISLSKDDATIQFKKFNIELDYNFDKLNNILSELDREHKRKPDFIPIGYLTLLADKENFKFEITYLSENVIIYSLIFDNLFEDGDKIIFNFAAEYDWDLDIPEKDFEIVPIPRQTAYEGIEFKYEVKLTGNSRGVMFTDFSNLFDIQEESGFIQFIPKSKDSGLNEILIKAYDNYGNEDIYIMLLDIEKNMKNVQK
tara:strand:- start:3431 stop:4456 length:1026 start_codon:yes stop_codon:yes gene_type:complete